MLVARNRDTCFFPAKAAAAAAAGWSPGLTVCPQCPALGICPYYKARNRARASQFIAGPWESAIRFAFQAPAARLIIDERPLRAYIRHSAKRIDRGVLASWSAWSSTAPSTASAIGELVGLVDLAEALRRRKGKQIVMTGDRLREFAQAAGLDSGRLLLGAIGDDAFAGGALWDPPAGIPAKSASDLLTSLAFQVGAPRPQPCALVVDDDGAHFRLASVDRRLMGRPASLLDAYGDPAMYAGILGLDVDTVTIDIADRSHYWFVECRGSRRAFGHTQRRAALYRQLAEAIDAAEASGEVISGARLPRSRILVVTHRSELDSAEFRAVADGCRRRYFGSGFGVNAYRGCQAVIVFGTPFLPPLDVWLLGCAVLTPDTGEALAEALPRFAEALIDQEIAQQVHRIRPALSPVPATVFVLSDRDCPALPRPIALKRASGASLMYSAALGIRHSGAWDPAPEESSHPDLPTVRRMIRERLGL